MKLPPHSILAEENVLGALMIREDCWDEISDILDGKEFYNHNHQLIYSAISDLVNSNSPTDAVTVAERLEVRGELDHTGGLQYLTSVCSSVSNQNNAKAYAEIVRDHYHQREMLAATFEIQDRIYTPEGMDSSQVMDLAESRVMGVRELSEKNKQSGLISIKSSADETLDWLDYLKENPDKATGVSTGFYMMDHLTNGLQKGDLIIIAARPSVGKTQKLLNIAAHAAIRQNVPVAFFSLEMPSQQLIIRLLSSEAKVQMNLVRNGTYSDAENARIVEAHAKIRQAPIYIDDTPAISEGDIRSRCRKIHRECGGLGLVCVDYLQLLRAKNKAENRNLEIAQFTGGLKALAKELNLPVVVLSQLNRALEKRSDRRPILSDLRDCVSGDTLVTLANGKRIKISELEGKSVEVLSLNSDWKVESAKCDKIWKVGKRKVYEIILQSGRKIKCTGNHKIKLFDSWAKVSDIKVGNRVAIPRRTFVDVDNVKNELDYKIIFIGHMIGDGTYRSNNAIRYTTGNDECAAIMKECAEKFGCTVKVYDPPGKNCVDLSFANNGNRWHPKNVNKWLRDIGVFNSISYEKRVPEFVFSLTTKKLALFIKHLWSTDGCLVTTNGKYTCHYCTTSEGLVKDVASLLLRFGIVGRIRKTSQGDRGRDTFECHVTGENIYRFCEKIGGFAHQREPAQEIINNPKPINTNVDTIPKEYVSDPINKKMKERGLIPKDIHRIRGIKNPGGTKPFAYNPSRGVLLDYAQILNLPSLISAAKSDIFWDVVKSIEEVGMEDVYDLTVPGNASWISNDIFSHNSGSVEQDADVISFLYRDEIYNPDSPDKGVAEVILAKQRQGPIGNFKLLFLGQYATFKNYDE